MGTLSCNTLAKLLACLLALALSSLSLADGMQAPTELSGDPGSVVAVPLETSGPGTLRVDVPDGIVLLGHSDTSVGGRVLITVLIGPGTLAGDYPVHLTLSSDQRALQTATVVVHVKAIAAIRIQNPAPPILSSGKAEAILVSILNTGNARDTILVSADGLDNLALDSNEITLGPGKSKVVKVSVSPRSFGQRYFWLAAKSTLDPAVKHRILVKYEVLALGAKDVGDPFLQLMLPLGITYGSTGWDYRGGLSLSGDLSDFVSTAASFSAAPSTTHASLGFVGADWSLLYGYGSTSGNDLSLAYGGGRLRASLSPEGRVTTGLGYSEGPWSVYVSHLWGQGAVDTATAGYTVRFDDNTSTTFSLGATGNVEADGSYHVSPLGQATLRWAGPVVGLQLTGRTAPYSSDPWSATAFVYSRLASSFKFHGFASVDPSEVSASVSVQEKPDDRFTLAQQASYTSPDSVLMQFGVQYDADRIPLSVQGIVDAAYQANQLSTREALATTYTDLPWVASARITVTPDVTVSYGQTYVGPNFAVGGSIALPLGGSFQPLVGLRATYAPSDFRIGIGAAYDTAHDEYSATTSLGFDVTQGLRLTGTVGYDSITGVDWQVGVSATLLTGFAVPRDLSEAFGGRDRGTITGTVTLRSDDGSLRAGDGIVVGVLGSDAATTTGKAGAFTLNLRPGSYTLTFPGLPAYLTPPKLQPVVVPLHATVRQDVTMAVAYAVTGQVVAQDQEQQGPVATSARGVSGIDVSLTASDGTRRVSTSDVSGMFSFSNVRPGQYVVQLVASSLPSELVLAQESKATIDVAGQSMPFVTLKVSTVPKTVVNTLGAGTLSLSVQLQPTTVPPGAFVSVTATASQASRVTAQVGTSAPVTLEEVRPGSYEGDVEVPRTVSGVAIVKVEGSGANGHAAVTQMIFVQPGPLATLKLSDTYVRPGDAVTITARLLVKSDHVELTADGHPVTLKVVGKRALQGVYKAPTEPGIVKLALSVNGNVEATMNLTVTSSP